MKKRVKFLENQVRELKLKSDSIKFDPFKMAFPGVSLEISSAAPSRPQLTALSLEMSDYYDIKMPQSFKDMIPKTHASVVQYMQEFDPANEKKANRTNAFNRIMNMVTGSVG